MMNADFQNIRRRCVAREDLMVGHEHQGGIEGVPALDVVEGFEIALEEARLHPSDYRPGLVSARWHRIAKSSVSPCPRPSSTSPVGPLSFPIRCRGGRMKSASAWLSGHGKTDVMRMVLRDGLRLTACGMAVGLPGALYLTRFLRTFSYGVVPADLTTFSVVCVILGVAALLASYLPARRADRVDPMAALCLE